MDNIVSEEVSREIRMHIDWVINLLKEYKQNGQHNIRRVL